MSNNSFDFNQFITDSVNTLFKPAEYFAGLQPKSGFVVPIIKAVIYGTIAGLFNLIWGLLHLGSIAGGMFGGAIGIMGFIGAIIGSVIGLFVGAVFILIISAICGGSTDYEENINIAGSMMVLMPITAVFGFLGGFISSLVGFIINLYGLYILYFAVTKTLKGKENTAKILSYVLGGLLFIFVIVGFFTRKATEKFMDDYGIEFEQSMEDLEKGIKDNMKDLTDELEEATKDENE